MNVKPHADHPAGTPGTRGHHVVQIQKTEDSSERSNPEDLNIFTQLKLHELNKELFVY